MDPFNFTTDSTQPVSIAPSTPAPSTFDFSKLSQDTGDTAPATPNPGTFDFSQLNNPVTPTTLDASHTPVLSKDQPGFFQGIGNAIGGFFQKSGEEAGKAFTGSIQGGAQTGAEELNKIGKVWNQPDENIPSKITQILFPLGGAAGSALAGGIGAPIAGVAGLFAPIVDAIKNGIATPDQWNQFKTYIDQSMTKAKNNLAAGQGLSGPEEESKLRAESGLLFGLGGDISPTLGETSQALKGAAETTAKVVSNAADNFMKTITPLTPEEKIAQITSRIDELKQSGDVQQVQDIQRIAQGMGIDLPASATGGKLAQNIEGVTGEGLFGGSIKDRATTALDQFQSSVQDIADQAPTSGALGEDILNKFKQVEQENKAAYDALYKQADDIAANKGSSITVAPAETTPLLKDLIDREGLKFSGIGDSSVQKTLNSILEGVTGTTKLSNWSETLKAIGDQANFGAYDRTTAEKYFGNVYGAMKNDITSAIREQAPQMQASLDAANKTFSEWQALKDRPFAKTIVNAGKLGNTDTIADRLTNTKVSANEINKIYDTLGTGVTEKIQSKIMANIIEKAKSATGGFTPGGFTKQIASIGEEKLQSVLSAAQYARLKDIAKLNDAMANITKVARGSPTAYLTKITDVSRYISTLPTLGANLVGEWGLSKFLNSKLGQTWLKTLGKPELKELMNLEEKLGKLKTSSPTEPLAKIIGTTPKAENPPSVKSK